MKPLSLGEFADNAEEMEEATIALRAEGLASIRAVQTLRKLRRLGLLTDEVVLTLIGEAPIDPFGIFALLQPLGSWAFSANDFTVVRVLAKQGTKPVALMRVDLLSSDVYYVVLREGKLVERTRVTADELSRLEGGAGEVVRTIEATAQETIVEGMGNA